MLTMTDCPPVEAVQKKKGVGSKEKEKVSRQRLPFWRKRRAR